MVIIFQTISLRPSSPSKLPSDQSLTSSQIHDTFLIIIAEYTYYLYNIYAYL